MSYTINYADKSYLPRKIDSIKNILSSLSTSQQKIIFIQIGSNDGVSGDPLNEFINVYD